MKSKHLFTVVAALVVAGGLWFCWTGWRGHSSDDLSTGKSGADSDRKSDRSSNVDPNSRGSLFRTSQTKAGRDSTNGLQPNQKLRPPDQARKFMEFTPEERVKFARRGHGPGG